MVFCLSVCLSAPRLLSQTNFLMTFIAVLLIFVPPDNQKIRRLGKTPRPTGALLLGPTGRLQPQISVLILDKPLNAKLTN